MSKKLIVIAASAVVLLACSEPGKVDQGRVIAFDKDARQVTIIRDKGNDALSPDYSILPPVSYILPDDPAQTGPLPKAGGRMKLDLDRNQIVIFDTASAAFKTVDFVPVDRRTGISRDDPLVKDRKFPIIDRDQKTVTVYSGRLKLLQTFRIDDRYFNLPDSSWDSGDEVRIYYRVPGKASRFMNISQTDIFKK